MDAQELQKVIKKHEKWLRNEKGGERADLGGADLRGADLHGADLRGVYLHGAYLHGADLRGADLGGVSLGDITVNWISHDLIAEILKREAGDHIGKLQAAGLILVSRDKCWDELLALKVPHKKWALRTLAKWVKEGDGAPEVLKKLSIKEK